MLGPVAVEDGTGGRVGAKHRALLAALASRPGRWVSTDVLIDALWPGAVPRTARKTLQGHVVHLRRLLGQGAVLFRDGAYRLDPQRVSVDALDAAVLAERARGALAAGDLATAARSVAEADMLWRGEPYDGVDPEALPAGELQRLAELRWDLFDAGVDVALAEGRHRAVIGELERYLGEYPLRETAWAKLVIALYRSGRTPDALAALSRARMVLASELGIDPGPELREVERAVLAHDADLLGDPSAPRAGPRPDPRGTSRRLIGLRSGRFVGRHAELAVIGAAVDEAKAGNRRVVTISGEPGAGKTALVACAALRAEQAGVRSLYVRCDERLGIPFTPVAGWLDELSLDDRARGWFDIGSERRDRLAGILPVGALARLWPEPDQPIALLDPARERLWTLQAIDDVLTSAAHDQPIVAVVDDLQWADPGTLDALCHLAQGRDCALVVVAIMRDEHRRPDVVRTLVDLDRSARHTRVTLGGLDRADLDELVALTLGHRQPRLADDLAARTDGNPLFARALLDALVATGDASSPAVALPDTIRDLVASRLDHLGRSARSLIEVGSLIGRTFSIGFAGTIAAELGGTDPHPAASTIDELLGAALVNEIDDGPTLAFTHDVFRDAVRDARSAAWRREAHARIADHMERSQPPDVAALAHHHVAAGNAERSAHWLGVRARRRAASGMLEAAVDDLTDALGWDATNLGAEPGQRVGLLETRGDQLVLLGRHDDAATDYDTALAIAGRERRALRRRARLLRKCGHARRQQRRLDDADRSLLAADELLGHSPPGPPDTASEWIELQIEIGWLDYFSFHRFHWAVGRLGEAASFIDRAGTIEQRISAHHVTADILNIDAGFSGPPHALEEADWALQLAIQLGAPGHLAEAEFGYGVISLCARQLDDATAHLSAALDSYRKAANTTWQAISLLYLAIASRYAGLVDRTRDLCHAALTVGDASLHAPYRAILDGNLAWCALRVDEIGRARQLADAALTRWDAANDPKYPFTHLILWPALATAVRADDNHDIARLCERILEPTLDRQPADLLAGVSHYLDQPAERAALEQSLVRARTLHWT